MSASTRVRALPRPPYYAAIFTSRRNAADSAGYADVRARMVEIAAMQPGFLGMDSARDSDGFGISVSYWTSEDAIRAWRAQSEQGATRESELRGWYEDYDLKIARIDRAYEWSSQR